MMLKRAFSLSVWLQPSSQSPEASRAGSPHFTGEETKLKIIKRFVSSGARTPAQASTGQGFTSCHSCLALLSNNFHTPD